MRRLTIATAAMALSLIPGAAVASEKQPAGLMFAPEIAGPGDLVTVRTTACGPAASVCADGTRVSGTLKVPGSWIG